jgi:hypothetical protein
MNKLFLFGCIPIRLLLVYISTKIDNLKLFSIPLFLIAFVFLYLYFTNGRLNAREAGGITWWSQLRLIHGLLYLTAGIYALQNNKLCWVPLLIDVVFGFLAALFFK